MLHLDRGKLARFERASSQAAGFCFGDHTLRFEFKLRCEQEWNPFDERWEEVCYSDGGWWEGYIVGAGVFGAFCAVALLMIYVVVICLRCKVC